MTRTEVEDKNGYLEYFYALVDPEGQFLGTDGTQWERTKAYASPLDPLVTRFNTAQAYENYQFSAYWFAPDARLVKVGVVVAYEEVAV